MFDRTYRQRLEADLAARADRDVAALLGQHLGNALADTFAAAGYDGLLAVELEVECHGSLLGG